MYSDIVNDIILSVFVFMGAVASLLLNLNEAYVVKDFSFKTFLKQNIVSFLTNVVIGIVIVTAARDDDRLEFTKLTAFILGAVSQQFFKKLCNAFSTQKPTYIGINKSKQYEEDIDTADGSDANGA